MFTEKIEINHFSFKLKLIDDYLFIFYFISSYSEI